MKSRSIPKTLHISKSEVTLTHLIGTSLTHLFFFHLGPPGPPHPKDHPSVAEVEQVEQVLLQRSKLKDLPAKFAGWFKVNLINGWLVDQLRLIGGGGIYYLIT